MPSGWSRCKRPDVPEGPVEHVRDGQGRPGVTFLWTVLVSLYAWRPAL